MKYLSIFAAFLSLTQVSLATPSDSAPKRRAVLDEQVAEERRVSERFDRFFEASPLKDKYSKTELKFYWYSYIKELKSLARRTSMSQADFAEWEELFNALFLEPQLRNGNTMFHLRTSQTEIEKNMRSLFRLDLNTVKQQIGVMRDKLRLKLSPITTINFLNLLNKAQYRAHAQTYIALISHYMGNSYLVNPETSPYGWCAGETDVDNLLKSFARLANMGLINLDDASQPLREDTEEQKKFAHIFRLMARIEEPNYTGSKIKVLSFIAFLHPTSRNPKEAISYIEKLIRLQGVDERAVIHHPASQEEQSKLIRVVDLLDAYCAIPETPFERGQLPFPLRIFKLINSVEASKIVDQVYPNKGYDALLFFLKIQNANYAQLRENYHQMASLELLKAIDYLLKTPFFTSIGEVESKLIETIFLALVKSEQQASNYTRHLDRFLTQDVEDKTVYFNIERGMKQRNLSPQYMKRQLLEIRLIRVKQIMETPITRAIPQFALDNALQRLHAAGANVHIRDEATREALKLFMDKMRLENKEEEEKLCQSLELFVKSVRVNNAISLERRELFLRALLLKQKEDKHFGPLWTDDMFSIVGYPLTGKTFAIAIWKFIDSLPADSDKKEAQDAFVNALIDCFEQGQLVCNPGKVQRILIAVVQGRMAGVEIDQVEAFMERPPKQVAAELLNEFFTNKEHQTINDWNLLQEAATRFIEARPEIRATAFEIAFRKMLLEYAVRSGILEEPAPVQQAAAAE